MNALISGETDLLLEGQKVLAFPAQESLKAPVPHKGCFNFGESMLS